jgi:hypothetical protein
MYESVGKGYGWLRCMEHGGFSEKRDGEGTHDMYEQLGKRNQLVQRISLFIPTSNSNVQVPFSPFGASERTAYTDRISFCM